MHDHCSAGCHRNILLELMLLATNFHVLVRQKRFPGEKKMDLKMLMSALLLAQVFPSQNSSCLEFTHIPVEITVQYPCIPHVQPQTHTSYLKCRISIYSTI